MIDRGTAINQLNRLSSLPYFKTISHETGQEWLKALSQADDPAHAARAVQEILKTRTLPQSADEIKDALDATRTQQAAQSSEGRHCDLCRHGRPPGWITIERVHRGQVYTFSGKCPQCNPGWYAKPE